MNAAEAESDGCEDQSMENYIEYASEDLADIPSADVVQVVRCGDCLFCQMELYDGADEPWCDVHNTTVDTEAFCSWGKGKNNG